MRSPPASTVRSAFTLIELLIVIAVIALLATMLIVSAGIIMENLKKAKSLTIVGTVHTAMENASALRGLRPAPVEHPLAASAATDILSSGAGTVQRAIFYRAEGGDAVLRTDEALRVDDLSWVDDAAQDRVLLSDDVYAGHELEGDTPLLFGLTRRHIGVLGASCDWITTWRDLPNIDGPYRDPSNPSQLLGPYDGTVYKDGEFLYRPQLKKGQTLEAANQQLLETMLSTHMNELNELGAIKHANEPDTDNWITTTVTTTTSAGDSTYTRKVDVMQPEKGSYDGSHRIWLANKPTRSKWKPGHYDDEGSWKAYHLRGYSVVDSYGVEILFWQDEKRNNYIQSAGPDGVFAVNPGNNGIIDTPISSYRYGDIGTLSGDDEDGKRDNIGAFDE